ncbi:O-acetyl-ADP-ribose deacetylase MACROD2, partial [Trifolium medium]|nr:O-acetyl-ADP-ribose deacetylase MACROD2 [Trifolium medium]
MRLPFIFYFRKLEYTIDKKVVPQKAVPDCDEACISSFKEMTREKTSKLIKEIVEKNVAGLTIISENDRKFTSQHSNAVNLRTSFPPSGMNISARFHLWYNDDSVVRFSLSSSNTLIIQGGDISQWFIDGSTNAIVSPANARMLGGGGANGSIYRTAGPDLVRACQDVPEGRPGVRCPIGEARITP